MPDQHEPEDQLQKAQDAIDEARNAAADALPQDDLPAPAPDAQNSPADEGQSQDDDDDDGDDDGDVRPGSDTDSVAGDDAGR